MVVAHTLSTCTVHGIMYSVQVLCIIYIMYMYIIHAYIYMYIIMYIMYIIMYILYINLFCGNFICVFLQD